MGYLLRCGLPSLPDRKQREKHRISKKQQKFKQRIIGSSRGKSLKRKLVKTRKMLRRRKGDFRKRNFIWIKELR